MNKGSESNADSPGSPPKTGDLRRDTKPLKHRRATWLTRLTSRPGLAGLALASLALLGIAAFGAWIFFGRPGVGQNNEFQLTPPISLDQLATEYPELATILQDPEMDSAYKEFLVVYQTGGEAAALEHARRRGLLNANGDLRLTLELDTTDTAALEAELEANWIEVTAVSGDLMDIALPIERLEMMMDSGNIDEFLAGITALDHVVRIRLPKVGIEDAPRPLLTFMFTPALPVATTPGANTATSMTAVTVTSTSTAMSPALQAPSATPSATSTPESGLFPGLSGLSSPNNAGLVALGVILCVVAPLLMVLGAFLLLSGMGLIRRGSKVGAAPAGPGTPSRITPPAALPGRDRETADRPQTSGSPDGVAPGVRHEPAAGSMRQPQGAAATPQRLAPDGFPPSNFPSAAEICSSCGHLNRVGARFCNACGRSLAGAQPEVKAHASSEPPPRPPSVVETPAEHPTFCWNCGHKLRPTSRFCPNCGDRI